MLRKAFSAITSKLPKLIKTIVAKVPQTLQTIGSSSAFNQVIENLKTNQNAPQAIKKIAAVITDDRFKKKLQNVGANTVGMTGTALAASSIMGPQAGMAVEAIGLGKDIYDLVKGYKQVSNEIDRQRYSKTKTISKPDISLKKLKGIGGRIN